MKRQILTLTMCLALTATSALAEGTKAVTTPSAAPAAVAATAKPVAKAATPVAKPAAKTAVKPVAKSATKPAAKASTKCTAKAAAKKVVKPVTPVVAAPVQPKVLTREEARRAALYEKLGFTDEQKTKAEAFDAKTRDGVAPLMGKLHTEAKKYKDLKAKKANIFVLWQQKQVVKAAKKDVDKFFQKSKVEFEAIMTPAQKAKFEAFEAQRKKDRAAHKHGGPKMGPKPPMGAPEHMGPPPAEMGPEGPQGPAPVGPPPADKN